jgi:hypothetical protein
MVWIRLWARHIAFLWVVALVAACGDSVRASTDAASEQSVPALSDAGAAVSMRDAAAPRRDAASDAAPSADGEAGLVDAGHAGDAEAGFCPGYSAAMFATATLCRTAADCPQPGSFRLVCERAPIRPQCGGAAPPPSACTRDAECANNDRCIQSCGRGYCVPELPPCTADSCGAAASCIDARCVAFRCDEGAYQCPDWASCTPDDVGNADEHGCVARNCSADTDCACGTCVEHVCAPHPGVCAREDFAP